MTTEESFRHLAGLMYGKDAPLFCTVYEALEGGEEPFAISCHEGKVVVTRYEGSLADE